MTRWSEHDFKVFEKSRETAAQKQLREARNMAKHDANKHTEQSAKLLLTIQLEERGLVAPEWEYRFHDARKWRFDGAYVAQRIGIEIEGGTFAIGKSRHTNPKGYEADCEKYNAAAALGWRVVRVTYAMIRDGRACRAILDATNHFVC